MLGCLLLHVHHHKLVVGRHLLSLGQVLLQKWCTVNLASFLNIEVIGHLALDLCSKRNNLTSHLSGIDILSKEWLLDHVLEFNQLVLLVHLVEGVAEKVTAAIEEFWQTARDQSDVYFVSWFVKQIRLDEMQWDGHLLVHRFQVHDLEQSFSE